MPPRGTPAASARLAQSLQRLGLAALQLGLGLALGLLLRGMPLPAAIDAPVTLRTYTVRYSDADAIFWRPDLVTPLTPATDQVESVVNLQTDEFGFRNPPPLPAQVQVVVLGRSTSLGAQNAHPWPELLAASTGGYVLNLAEPSGGITTQTQIWNQYGQPRHPRWVILETAPRIDFADIGPTNLRLQDLALPLAQGLARLWIGAQLFAPPIHPIYPLTIDVPRGTAAVTCCIHYMDFMSLDQSEISASRDWAGYRDRVLGLARQVRASGACMALLYATAKEEVYFASALRPEQLAPVLNDVTPLHLGPSGDLEPATGLHSDALTVSRNVFAGRDVMSQFARENGLLFIDPSAQFIQAFAAGDDPYMAYDSHWNARGHELIAQLASQLLASQACP